MRNMCVLIVALVVFGLAAPLAAQTAPTREQTVFVNDQQTVNPGYPVGDIAIGDPKIADFRVLAGRRELLIFGRAVGTTRLTLWDQQKVKRDEILITVTTRQAQQLEGELRDILKDFPSVEVRMFAGALTITGTASSKEDLAAIEKIASAAKVRNLVRVVPPAGAAVSSGAGSPAAAREAAAAAAAAVEIEYEVELLEASSKFRSGSYATGVEPSGRSLHKQVLRAPVGVERDLFIGGNAVQQKSGSNNSAAVQTGLKLTLRPIGADTRGRYRTAVLIETNLPFAGEGYDPAIWRRARWEFQAASGEPFGITGADLLATPGAERGGSALRDATRTGSQIGSLTGAPGVEYVPIFGSLFGSRSYKQNQTQLLVILRTRVIPLQK
jgi:hypothetical protein